VPKADKKAGASADDVFSEYLELVAMQKLVSDLSRSLVHCSSEDIRSTIDDGLARLGAFVQADRAYVFEFIVGGIARNTHEWCSQGIEPEIDNLQNLPRDMLDFWITSLTQGQPIHVPDVALLGGERAFEREFLATQDIQSLLVVPMLAAENLLGFVGFDCVRSRRTYRTAEINLLTWAADLMCAALLREKSAREMIVAADALSLEKERFRIIASTVSDVLWDCDLDTHAWWISHDWPERLGISVDPSERDARSWFERVLPDDRPKLMMSFRQLLKSDSESWEVDYRLRGNDGDLIDILVNATVLRGPQGRVSRMLGNARNVTKEKRTQEGYTRARALEAVGQLTGGVAHDFNNMLMIILGNAELLEATRLDENQAESVAMIHRASISAADLTRRLLSFSRQSQLRAGRVELTNLLRNTVALLRTGIPETITIRCDVSPDMWQANVDGNALEQAIVNLAVNARDAMPDGGEIAVKAENQRIVSAAQLNLLDLQPGDYVVVSVTDNGQGMAPEVLARAFEPFFTTKDVGEGTGLGLSTVFGFAKQSGGHATLKSEPGRGTTVRIYLPRFEPGEYNESRVPKTEQATHGAGQRILMVEDEPMVRAHVEKLLSKLGYVVTAATDAQEALSLLREGQTFDLLFTDVIMPGGLTGPQLGQAALQLAPHIKLLYTSGYPASAFENLGLEDLSNVNFLAKPYRSTQLKETLASIWRI
jgi:PAS domain S-box-containing protein